MRGYPVFALLCAAFFVALSSYLPLVQGAALATPAISPTPITTEASAPPTGTLVFNLGDVVQNGTSNATTGKPASNTSSSNSPASNKYTVIGIIVGVILALIVIIGLIFWIIRRRKETKKRQVGDESDLFGGVEEDFIEGDQEERSKDEAAEERRLANNAMRKQERERARAADKAESKKNGGALNPFTIFGGSGSAGEAQGSKEKTPTTEGEGKENRKRGFKAIWRRIKERAKGIEARR